MDAVSLSVSRLERVLCREPALDLLGEMGGIGDRRGRVAILLTASAFHVLVTNKVPSHTRIVTAIAIMGFSCSFLDP